MRFDVGDRSRAAAIEQGERALCVTDAKGERAHAVRMLLQEAVRAPALAHWRRADDHVVTCAKRARALTAAFAERFTALGDLREVHPIDVEACAALQVAHVIVHTFQAEDPERFQVCHPLKVRRFVGRASLLAVQLSVWVRRGKTVQLRHSASNRSNVG